MKNTVIIIGAGDGKRIGNQDKAFLVLNNKPLLTYPIASFEGCKLINEIILVIKKDRIKDAEKIIHQYGFKKVKAIISGGKTRQDSVHNGLNMIDNSNIVLVHDIARPLIANNIIVDCIKNAKKFGAVVPTLKINDTIKKGDKFIEKTVDRKNLNLTQTPQAFKYKILQEAYEYAKKNNFYSTDEASLVEQLGYKIRIIPGSYQNLKVTFPEDVDIVNKFLKQLELIKEK